MDGECPFIRRYDHWYPIVSALPQRSFNPPLDSGVIDLLRGASKVKKKGLFDPLMTPLATSLI